MTSIAPHTWILGGALAIATLGAVHASNVGWGVTQPVNNPPDIREGSVKGRHHGRTRYFMGGGLRGGK